MTLFQFCQVNNKFGSLTDFLDKSKYVDLSPQRPKIYTYTNAKKTMTVKWKTVKSDDSLGVNTTPVTNILKDKPGPHVGSELLSMPSSYISQMKCLKRL